MESHGELELKSTNPKDVLGIKKVPFDLIPSTALVHQAMAHKCGAIKYGPANWRDEGVSARVYIAASLRHIFKYLEGQQFDEESGYHELGHAVACLNIIMDAEACDKLVDDRPPPAPLKEMLEQWKDA